MRVSELDDQDDDDDDDIMLLPSQPDDIPNTRQSLDEDEESDIKRYAGLMMKTATQTLSHTPEGIGVGAGSRQNSDPRQANCSSTVIDVSSYEDARPQEVGESDEGKESDAARHQDEAAESPVRKLLRFGSIKSHIISRLFGSQSTISAGGMAASEGADSCMAEGDLQTDEIKGRSVRAPSANPISAGSIPNYRAQNITGHDGQPPRSGGILSNLLKIQALSMPPSSSSRRHRKRRSRHHHRQDPRRQKNARKASVASEAPPTSTSRYLLSSPSASVLSLPGMVMAAPSGVGLTPNAATSSSTVVYPDNSRPATMGMKPQQISTFAGGAHRTRSGDDSSITTTPTTPNGTSLAPHRLGTMTPKYLRTPSSRSSISADDSTSIYSGISQDPLVAAYRLNQQAQLTEAVADILQCQDLLIRLCKSFIRYGAPSHRIELAMEAMCKTFGVDGSFAFLPGLMMISFGDSDTHTSETHLIKCAQGFDMGRLAKVHKIARAVVYKHMQPDEALANLKEINGEKQPYNMWVMLAAYAVSSGLIAPLVFKGSWYDMLAGMGLGSVVGLTTLLASRYSVYSNVFEVSTSIVIAFVAKALRDYVCFTGVVLSGIVMLLPGLSLTTAIMELSSRYMISGSVRMFYSLIYCLFLGFGLSIGSNLWDVFKAPPPGDPHSGFCHPATEPWRWILFPLLAIAFNVQLYALPRQWPVMVICSSVGYAVSEFAGLYWPHSLHIAAAVSAFVVGLLGNIYERLTHELAFVPILGAILLIVPGGMGVRSSLLLLGQAGNASQGTAFALQMILVALGIAVGLFASTLVVYPLGKKRNALLTF
ncbi:hypothetical protein EC968_010348 [Mortierella alpina]|nr:hypothetical protein EC968_010348 [Mortierella alpina]